MRISPTSGSIFLCFQLFISAAVINLYQRQSALLSIFNLVTNCPNLARMAMAKKGPKPWLFLYLFMITTIFYKSYVKKIFLKNSRLGMFLAMFLFFFGLAVFKNTVLNKEKCTIQLSEGWAWDTFLVDLPSWHNLHENVFSDWISSKKFAPCLVSPLFASRPSADCRSFRRSFIICWQIFPVDRPKQKSSSWPSNQAIVYPIIKSKWHEKN